MALFLVHLQFHSLFSSHTWESEGEGTRGALTAYQLCCTVTELSQCTRPGAASVSIEEVAHGRGWEVAKEPNSQTTSGIALTYFLRSHDRKPATV